ncbi:MAG: BBP7 family outer membrane beta-barrel protein [Planctomycetes bacterium]|nr:BBP7 family outer membrane beta-barrel protein [Planctomycetota bacterium]
MRKAIFSAVVIVLAGTCWVLAQNASSPRPPSPYGFQTAPIPKPQAPAVKAQTPAEKAEELTNPSPIQPVVLPTTELEIPSIPKLPALPKIPDPSIKYRPDDPVVAPPIIEPSPNLNLSIPEPKPPVAVPNVDLKIPDVFVPATQPNVNLTIPEPRLPVGAPSIDLKIPEPFVPVTQPNPNLAIPEPKPSVAAPSNDLKIPEPVVPTAQPNQTLKIPEPKLTAPQPAVELMTPEPLAPVALPMAPRFEEFPKFAMPVLQAPAPTIGLAPPEPIEPLPPPLPQPMDGRPIARPMTQAALPGLPPLPPVPGVIDPTFGVPQPVTVNDNDPGYWEGRTRYNNQTRELGPRIWATADYLFWYVKPLKTPPLAIGVLGVQPDDTDFQPSQVQQLYPTGSDKYNPMNGAKGTFGFWFNSIQTIGFEASYFWFDQVSNSEAFRSIPGVILGRPFVNTETGRGSIYQLSYLDGTEGGIRVQTQLKIEGGDANLLGSSLRFGQRLTALAGFRYLDLSEKARIEHYSVNSDYLLQGYDHFGTRNQFFGGQLGLRWNYQGERLFASLTGKVAFGTMQQQVRIKGGSSLTGSDGTNIQADGGVLALPSNIGSYDRNQTSFIPEVTATVGYRFTPWMSAHVGYNFLYMTNVVRPGKQIDSNVDAVNFPFNSGGGALPSFSFRSEDFWMQGMNFGVTFQY